MTTTRRAMYVTRTGGPEVLALREEPVGSPGKGEVLVEVAYSGVNFADLAARAGLYPEAPKTPMVLGYELSGHVTALGPGVDTLAVGDAVVAARRFGAYASHAVVGADSTRKLPQGMSLEQAAAIPVAYATAWWSLAHMARVRAGEDVLIHAAAGGVGVAATQLAKHLGLTTYGTASTDEKLAFCKSNGLDHGINYAREDFVERIKALTQGRGVHLVIDSVAGPILNQSYDCLAVGGMLIVIGATDLYPSSMLGKARMAVNFMRMRRFSALDLILKNRCVAGLQLMLVWDALGSLGSIFEDILGLYERGVVRPVVDRVFPLSAAAEAHRYLAARKTKGKVLLDARR